MQFSDAKMYFRQQYFETLDLLIDELKQRFQQRRGLPVMAVLEKVLMDYANGITAFCSTKLPHEFDLYKDDLDLSKLKTQLSMLPDLIVTRNSRNSVPIKKVTIVRTICDIINETNDGREMLSEVIKLLKIFYTLPTTTCTGVLATSHYDMIIDYFGEISHTYVCVCFAVLNHHDLVVEYNCN